MLLIDDILFAPARGILWIFEEIHNAAKEEMVNDVESITEQLRNLYMQLETRAITEEQFDAEENILLDRLDSLEARGEAEADEREEEVVEDR